MIEDVDVLIIMQFSCSCGFRTDLKAQQGVITHMKACEDFKVNSPLHQALEEDQLKDFNIEQLLIFQADLSTWSDLVKGLLEEKGFKQAKKSNLNDYNQFTTKQAPLKKQKKEQQLSESEIIQNLDHLEDNNGYDSFDMNLLDSLQARRQLESRFDRTNGCCQCGRTKPMRSNKIYTIECGHQMCQKCFVEMYRGPYSLHCPKCEGQLDKQFVVKAGTNQDQSACTICEKAFLKETYVRKHIHSVHLQEQKKFCCDMCTKPFSLFAEVKMHREIKHGVDRQTYRHMPEEVITLDSGSQQQQEQVDVDELESPLNYG